MQAVDRSAANQGEPFLFQKLGEIPWGLIVIWILAGIGWICLIAGFVLDEITYSVYNCSGEQQCTCGISQFTCVGSGFKDTSYTAGSNAEEVFAVDQERAGTAFAVLMIIAIIMSLICIAGCIIDVIKSEYDAFVVSNIWESCPCFKTMGLTTLGLVLVGSFEGLGLLIYMFSEQCSTEDFWDVYQTCTISDFTVVFGFGMFLVIFSLIMFIAVCGLVAFTKKQYGEFPHGIPKPLPLNLDRFMNKDSHSVGATSPHTGSSNTNNKGEGFNIGTVPKPQPKMPPKPQSALPKPNQRPNGPPPVPK